MSVAPNATPTPNQASDVVSKYNKISNVITNTAEKWAISATYTGSDPNSTALRKLWPHVLGKSPNPTTGSPVETVLCYQYDDGMNPTEVDPSHPSRKNFRCFRLSALDIIDVIRFTTPDPPNDWKPFKLKFKQVKKQTCVEDPDVFR